MNNLNGDVAMGKRIMLTGVTIIGFTLILTRLTYLADQYIGLGIGIGIGLELIGVYKIKKEQNG